MNKIIVLLILFISCSDESIDITTYDFTAFVEITIQDIKTDTGMIIHTSKTTRTLKDVSGISASELSTLEKQFLERIEIKDNILAGNLTIRTTNKYYNKIR